MFSKFLLLSACSVLWYSPAYAQLQAERSVDPRNPPSDLQETALFEFLEMRQTNGVLPTPIGSLIEELVYADYNPARVLIPYGRSLQAPQTNEQFPRKVIASISSNKIPSRPPLGFEDYSSFRGTDWEGRLFFGHAELDNSVEVISWNAPQGRFDFFIIHNYDNPRAQEFIEPTRNACVSCHQNGGPIFPPQPWAESLTHDPLEHNIGEDRLDFFRTPPELYHNRNNIILTREQTPTANNSALAIGFSAMVGTRLLQASNAVRNVCGTDKPCRLNILTAAVLNPRQSRYMSVDAAPQGEGPLDFDFDAAERNLRRDLENNSYPRDLYNWRHQLQRLWSPTGYALPDEFIPDMSVVADGTVSPRAADPRTQRELARPVRPELALPYIVDVAFQALGFRNEHREQIQIITSEFAIRTLRENFYEGSYHQVVNYFLEQWPPHPNAVTALFQAAADNRPFTIADAEDAASGRVSNFNSASLPMGDVQGLFQRYCAACHSQIGIPVPFDSIAAMQEYTRNGQNLILARMQSAASPMPPRNAPQPSDDERQMMIAAVQGRTASLAEAQQAVVGDGRQFNSHLDVPVMARPTQYLSYIAANSSTTFRNEGRYDPCLTMRRSNTHQAVWAAEDELGNRHLALENFPSYILGSIVQTFVLPAYGQISCIPAALTRSGAIIGLIFDREKQRFYEQTFTQIIDYPVQITYVAPTPRSYDDRIEDALVLARNGNIYSLTLQPRAQNQLHTYRLQSVQIERSNHLLWSKLVQTTSFTYAETNQGHLIRMTKSYGQYNRVRLTFSDTRNRVNHLPQDESSRRPRFAPNLLAPHRQNILIIPGQWHEDNRWRFRERWFTWRQ